MDPRTQERVEQWDSRPFNGGRDGLDGLADEGFSGVVTTGDVWLFVLNGRAVGVDGGDLEDVQAASGTAYVAPDPAPPLLAAMKTRGGETRAKYYTNKTPLSDVDGTLQDGSFTGYVELSEQVLSGDYYLVYYGGRRMAAAYIGNAERLLTGEEAFERAADEVGIYEVVDVGVDVVDLAEVVDDEPEEDGPASEPAGGEQQVKTAKDATVDDEAIAADATATTIETAEQAEPAKTEETSSGPTADELATGEPASPESTGDLSARDETDELEDAVDSTSNDRDPDEDSPVDMDDEETAVPSEENATEQTDESTPVEPVDEPKTEREDRSDKSRTEGDAPRDGETVVSFSEQVIDTVDEKEKGDGQFEQEEHVENLREQRDALQAKLEEYQDERERLEEQNEELTEKRDALRAKNRSLSATVERLEERVEELEAKLEHTRSLDETDTAAESTAESQISAQRALEGTNLFVRYESKGKATLEKAHAGEAGPEQVSENLRIEHHTDFDASDVAIDGQTYEEFLPTTMEYRFVDWLVDTLLYEIRDTGRTGGLADLYDAIPEIDRIEFAATVSLVDDDTEDVPEEVDFDVVVFDKMGRPLVVANLNDSRDPATSEMLERLEETASAVKANYPELAAASAVTSSFFEPGALEVTEAATSSGLLSRSSKLNYVNISRKQGYHLCLVEARSGGFHMTVPEL